MPARLTSLFYDVRGLYRKEGLDRLVRAFVTAADNGFLVPIFGALAENGQLPSTFVQAESLKVFEIVEQKMASLTIMLAQESWTTDRTNLLIGLMEEVVERKSPNEVYGQIMNTLTENRSTGPRFEDFLVQLDKLMFVDSYELKKRHVVLLRNALRRRTSRFANATMGGNFNLPARITEVAAG